MLDVLQAWPIIPMLMLPPIRKSEKCLIKWAAKQRKDILLENIPPPPCCMPQKLSACHGGPWGPSVVGGSGALSPNPLGGPCSVRNLYFVIVCTKSPPPTSPPYLPPPLPPPPYLRLASLDAGASPRTPVK